VCGEGMGLHRVACATACLAMICGASAIDRGLAADRFVATSPLSVTGATLELRVARGRSRLLRSFAEVRRTAVADPSVMEILQVSPSELVIIGRSTGTTHLTVWPGNAFLSPVVILVHVAANQ
jgi:Flp pilus assembly secretin CpaC